MTGRPHALAPRRAGGIQLDRDYQRHSFLALYPNRHRSIMKPQGCKSWTTLSRHYDLPDEQVIRAISGTETAFWGCRWGEQTRFAVLDIDSGSVYHNELGLTRLRQILACVGLNHPTLYQSSASEGWHLYLSFIDWVDSKEVHQALKDWLTANAFEVKTGQLEIFPSNNGLRFPLQPGFAWLDEKGQLTTRREQLNLDEALTRFLDALDEYAHDWELSKRLIETQLQAKQEAKPARPQEPEENEEDGFSEFFSQSSKILEVYEKGRAYWETGLTGANQRHDAILSVGHYLWYGDPARSLPPMPGPHKADRRRRVICDWFQTNHNGFCEAINKGDWKTVEEDIRRACFWVSTKPRDASYEPYPLTDRLIDRLAQLKTLTVDDLKEANERRETEARGKIARAVDRCLAESMQISRKTLEKITGCSPNTLRKHGDLWRHLAAGSGEYSFPPGAPLSFPGALPGSIPEEKEKKDFDPPSERETPGEPITLAVILAEFALEAEKDLDPSAGPGDSEGLRLAVAPPLLSCLAGEPTTCTQHQDQALRVPSEVLTPGPVLRGIQAVRQEAAGGGCFVLVSPLAKGRGRKERGPP